MNTTIQIDFTLPTTWPEQAHVDFILLVSFMTGSATEAPLPDYLADIARTGTSGHMDNYDYGLQEDKAAGKAIAYCRNKEDSDVGFITTALQAIATHHGISRKDGMLLEWGYGDGGGAQFIYGGSSMYSYTDAALIAMFPETIDVLHQLKMEMDSVVAEAIVSFFTAYRNPAEWGCPIWLGAANKPVGNKARIVWIYNVGQRALGTERKADLLDGRSSLNTAVQHAWRILADMPAKERIGLIGFIILGGVNGTAMYKSGNNLPS